MSKTDKIKSGKKNIINKNKKLKNHTLDQINLDAAGIDVGSNSHFVAIPTDRDVESVREFKCFTEDLHDLAAWLKSCDIKTVAMESTGVYWIPVYELLVEKGFEVFLVDARKIKNVSGRKTDIEDCQWIQQLHTYGLLQGAFIPELSVCELRSYVRQRNMLVKHTGTHIQHMQKALTQMNLLLQNVVSDITGVTGQKIIRAILAGERDPMILAEHRDRRCKNSPETIAKSLVGNFRNEHLFTLKQAVQLYDFYNKQIIECDQCIDKICSQFPTHRTLKADEQKKARKSKKTKNVSLADLKHRLIQMTGVDLTAIPGIDCNSALQIISNIGMDMSPWKTQKHFASWLGVSPMNKISGGKRLSSKTKRSNNSVTKALRMAAYSLHRSETAMGAYYRRMRTRLGAPKAITATARKISGIIYNMLKNKVEFVELGYKYYEKSHQDRIVKNLRRRAATLGFELCKVAIADSKMGDLGRVGF